LFPQHCIHEDSNDWGLHFHPFTIGKYPPLEAAITHQEDVMAFLVGNGDPHGGGNGPPKGGNNPSRSGGIPPSEKGGPINENG
jgi:hypothetical protein